MAASRPIIVAIASFELCSCTRFSDLEEHFAVSTSQADLYTATAVAISYTWGEFDRRKHVLGHPTGAAERRVSFELGAEWGLASFIHRLVQLTLTYQGVWIDQACLPQDVSDEEWADVLMSIPLVFKTLPVIALFPGRLCRCLSTTWQRYQDAVQGPQDGPRSAAFDTSKVVGEAYERLRDIITATECIYANGWCSWVDRIWPSEELRYSRQISVCWVEEGFADCRQPGNPNLKPEELSGLPLLLYREMQSTGVSHEDTMIAIRRRGSRWIRRLWLAIGENLKEYSEATSTSSFSLDQRKSEDMARFLLGDIMHFGNSSTALSDLFRFVWACEILAQTGKRATKAHDYIFSVWADWPSYQIPRSFSHLTCFELLADALDQFKSRDHQVFVPSSSPSGLINSSSPSWRFTCSLSKNPELIQDTHDVYRPFFWLNAMVGMSSALPLHIEQGTSRTSEPRLVKEWILELSTSAVLECVLEFKYRRDQRFVIDVVRSGTSDMGGNPFSLHGKSHLDVDDIFDFICLSLNLDKAKCRRANLQATCVQRQVTSKFSDTMTETQEIVCFGLANWEKIEDAWLGGQKALSVNITNEKWPLYEAVSLPGRDDHFSIAGVWVPLCGICECMLECVIDNEDINGVLV
ncbi:uncharacterized protein Z520_02627 [Fonsecaea multimorphosa CBS 102226]|uniref:Heterokaryon incompatibility domain-containing protein n=1 Tax=Fonsecaea multimorphosa CBS 102226 TaxID=1442371 RepID=A0A0D2KD02_9EURO|nr:uncharacterized protein Z520_02627 [Fonsecaea multimorphosa CBS 102226]KIY01075.1 hypothetical protein Z520_02627 [Fonsecaea multimorphosa CBS 102226]